jgi:hypothetical protein
MKQSRIECAAPMHFVVAFICSADRDRRDSGWTQSSSRAGSVRCLFLYSVESYLPPSMPNSHIDNTFMKNSMVRNRVMTSSGMDFFQSCILRSKMRRMICMRSSERLKLVLASSKPNAVLASSAMRWSLSQAMVRLSSSSFDFSSMMTHSSIQLLKSRMLGRFSLIEKPALMTYSVSTVRQCSSSSSGEEIFCSERMARFGSCSWVLGLDAKPNSNATDRGKPKS